MGAGLSAPRLYRIAEGDEVTKGEAESRKLQAEAVKFEAEAALAQAKAKREEAEARVARASAKQAEQYARQAVIATERAEEERDAELVSDTYRRVFRFSDSVTAQSVRVCMAVIEEWARLDEESTDLTPLEYEIVFTSPGGSVLHGMALFDYLRSLSRRGIKVITTCLGYSASMAGILLQAGDVRRMGAESYFHIHEISTGAIGKVSELEDEVEFSHKITARVVNIFVSRSQGSNIPDKDKLTASKLRKMFERREAWFSSDEALKYGLVDAIV